MTDAEAQRWHERYLVATKLLEEQRAAIAELTATLEVIERWELPPSGRNWADTGEPMSYAAAFGSSGEREYIRGLARAALSKHAPAQSQEVSRD